MTPSENNSNIDEIFSKREPQVEMPQIEENNPTSVEYTDLKIITNAMSKASQETEEQNPTEKTGEKTTKENTETSGVAEKENSSKEENQANCIDAASIIGDVNSIGNIDEEKELDGNFR